MQMKIKILIVDDEAHVREELEYIISQKNEFELLPSVSSGTHALKSLTQNHPDLILLDIDMPGLNGIEIGRIIHNMESPPYLLYVTAYDTYALEAFQVDAVGYLLKPISKQKVIAKLEQVKKLVTKNLVDKDNKEPTNTNTVKRIHYKLDERYVFFDQADLLYAYSKDREVYLRINGKDHLYNQPLSSLEEKLDPKLFFRCHRSYIVRIDAIMEVSPWFNGTYLIAMHESKESNIPVSRSKVKALKNLLNL